MKLRYANPWGYDHKTYAARFGVLPSIGGGEAKPDEPDEPDDESGGGEARPDAEQKPSIDEGAFRRRLERERKRLRADILAELQADQEAKDAEARGEFGTVKKGLEDRIKALEGKASRAEEYDELARARLKRMLKEFPKVIRDLAPDPDDEDADPLDIERWIATKGAKAYKDYQDEHGEGEPSSTKTRGADHRDPPRGEAKKAAETRVDAIRKEMETNPLYKPMF
jgi:hypothetical protein